MQVRFSLPMEFDEQVAKFHLPVLSAAHTVQGPVESVTERSTSLPRLAQALGMLVFRAASADLDVKVVAVNDPLRALDYMVYQLNTTESTGGSTHHRESGSLAFLYRQQKSRAFLAVVVKAAHTLTITIECVEKFAVCIYCADVESPARAGVVSTTKRQTNLLVDL